MFVENITCQVQFLFPSTKYFNSWAFQVHRRWWNSPNNYGSLAKLRPAFKKGGTTTAGMCNRKILLVSELVPSCLFPLLHRVLSPGGYSVQMAYGDLLPTWVAKSAAWYLNDPLKNTNFGVWLDQFFKFFRWFA